MQRRFGFLLDDPDDAYSWFIVLERDEQNHAVRVIVQQANSNGEVRNRWVAAQVNRNDAAGVTKIAKPAEDVGPPIVTPKIDEVSGKEKLKKNK